VVLFCVNWVGRLEHWLSGGVVFFVCRRVVSQQLENLSFIDFVLIFRVSIAVGVAVQVDAVSLLEIISVFGVTFISFEHLFVWGLLFIEVKTLEVLDVLFVFGVRVGVNDFNASFEVRGRTSLLSDALFVLNHVSIRTAVGCLEDWLLIHHFLHVDLHVLVFGVFIQIDVVGVLHELQVLVLIVLMLFGLLVFDECFLVIVKFVLVLRLVVINRFNAAQLRFWCLN